MRPGTLETAPASPKPSVGLIACLCGAAGAVNRRALLLPTPLRPAMEASLKQAVQQVWDELKCYHTEHVYKCALQIALQELGIAADAEVVHPIKFRDRVVGFQRFVRASPVVAVGPLCR